MTFAAALADAPLFFLQDATLHEIGSQPEGHMEGVVVGYSTPHASSSAHAVRFVAVQKLSCEGVSDEKLLSL